MACRRQLQLQLLRTDYYHCRRRTAASAAVERFAILSSLRIYSRTDVFLRAEKHAQQRGAGRQVRSGGAGFVLLQERYDCFTRNAHNAHQYLTALLKFRDNFPG